MFAQGAFWVGLELPVVPQSEQINICPRTNVHTQHYDFSFMYWFPVVFSIMGCNRTFETVNDMLHVHVYMKTPSVYF